MIKLDKAVKIAKERYSQLRRFLDKITINNIAIELKNEGWGFSVKAASDNDVLDSNVPLIFVTVEGKLKEYHIPSSEGFRMGNRLEKYGREVDISAYL